jgi:hypothetical protein
MKAIDSHCHIFNIVSVGLRALLEQLHESSELITSNKEARAVTTSAKAAAHQSIIDKLRKIVELIKIFSGDSVKILTLLDNHYKGDYQLFPLMFDGDFLLDTANEDENNQIKDITSNIRQHLAEDRTRRLSANALVDPKKFLSQNENDILLDLLKSIDYEIDASKGEKDGFSIQYNAIVSIKKNPKFQHKVYPFLGVDPRRKDIKTYLKQVGKDQLFAGIKIYAPNGFSPTDPLLDDVFKYCCTNHIPVIAHCSAGGFATPAMHIDINGYVLLPQKTQPEL